MSTYCLRKFVDLIKGQIVSQIIFLLYTWQNINDYLNNINNLITISPGFIKLRMVLQFF